MTRKKGKLEEFKNIENYFEEMRKMELEEFEILTKELARVNHLYASFECIKITVASPQRIRFWGMRYSPKFGEFSGEIKNSETIHFKNQKPVDQGLYCCHAFGPIKSWECSCGKYKAYHKDSKRLKKFCKDCSFEITDNRVRRFRMGFYNLNYTVPHFWYFSARPNYLANLLPLYPTKLDSILKPYVLISKEEIENIIYNFHDYRWLETSSWDPFEGKKESYRTRVDRLQIKRRKIIRGLTKFGYPEEAANQLAGSFINPLLSKYCKELKYVEHKLKEIDNHKRWPYDINYAYYYGLVFKNKNKRFTNLPRKAYLSEIIFRLISNLNIVGQIKNLKNFLVNNLLTQNTSSNIGIRHKKSLKRIRILESFLATKTKPDSIFLTALPILPAGLRLILETEDGRLITSDLNDFYRIIIMRNEHIFTQSKYGGFFIRRSFLALQVIVDGLIDNGRVWASCQYKDRETERPLKSLTERLETKEGRFRQNLFGKRVDFSGRSVIVSGPNLRLNQCGLPYIMAKILFEPLLYRKIQELTPESPRYSKAIKLIEADFKIKNLNFKTLIQILALLGSEYYVLLNRAPTLHKFGIQSFQPLIIFSQAIELHPLVCTGFNADFDGDQMGVYLPLLKSSQAEIQLLLKASNNIFSPANGEPVLKPTQDMVIGAYYMTLLLNQEKSFYYHPFFSESDILSFYYQKRLSVHTRVLLNFSLNNTNFRVNNAEVIFSDETLPFFEKKVIIKKVLYSQEISGTFKNSLTRTAYFLTNLGILIGRYFKDDVYQINHFFLETTPGRLLFTRNVKDSILYGRNII